ncbi:hypothetical protein COXBURSA331_A0450 [Coxiella burnetii RSA 331]|nr:hypothetical protein COXBURSA331_A0450 [Coxiella burnetii RSA 331]
MSRRYGGTKAKMSLSRSPYGVKRNTGIIIIPPYSTSLHTLTF